MTCSDDNTEFGHLSKHEELLCNNEWALNINKQAISLNAVPQSLPQRLCKTGTDDWCQMVNFKLFFFHPVFVHRTQVMKQLVDTTQFTMVFIPPAFIPFQHYTGS